MSVTCTDATVVVVRVDFPHADKLRSQQHFAGADCEVSTPIVWNCLFQAAIPVNAKISGSVRFAKAIPRATRTCVFFYITQVTADQNVLLPHGININPAPFVGTFAY